MYKSFLYTLSLLGRERARSTEPSTYRTDDFFTLDGTVGRMVEEGFTHA